MRPNLMICAFLLCSFAGVSTHAFAPPQGPLNACSLLSPQTAARLYGRPVTVGASGSAAADSMAICMFVNSDKGEAVSLVIQNLPPGTQQSLLDVLFKADAGEHVTPVAGLGERAMFKADSSSVTLTVLIHGRIAVLGLTTSDTPACRTALTSAMREIIGRL